MRILILSGGKGEGILPLTKFHPKILTSIHGKTFLHYLLRLHRKHDIVLSVGHMSDSIKTWCKDNDSWPEYVTEPFELGTGGAVLFAQPFLKNNRYFAVINGDTFIHKVKLPDLYSRLKDDAGVVYAPDMVDNKVKRAGIFFFKHKCWEKFSTVSKATPNTPIMLDTLLSLVPYTRIEIKQHFLDIGTHHGLKLAKSTHFIQE